MASSQEIFNSQSSIINQLHFGRTQEERNILAKALDDLNSLNYHCKIVTNYTKATLLINQCSTFIQPDDEILVQKFSQLLRNLINRQNVVVEGRTWTVTLQWCLNCLQIDNQLVLVDVLLSLDALLRSNVSNIPQKVVTGQVKSVLERFKGDTKSNDVILWSCNCLEACTITKSKELISQEDFNVCATVFLHYLCNNSKMDEISQSKILIVCLLGLQNIINQQPEFLKQELGLVLGIIKSYMVFGLKNINFITPTKLMPSTLSVPELTSTVQREKKGGKLTKQRKHKASSSKNETSINTDWLNDNKSNNYVPATGNNTDINLMSRLKMSDSDFSDSEGGKLAKLNISNGRVRQAALNLFYNVIKETEKAVIFFYWSNFIPETNSLGKHNLITCFLSDTSARGRMCALNVLLLLLTNTKQYLTQAEISGKFTSFTPFCVLLGLTLKELHNGLCFALNEVSIPVLTQVLKCLTALVQCTPYHRMPNGLITKIIRNVKQFIHHKDITIQVAALIVLGCILASEPTVVETKHALLSHESHKKTCSNVKNSVINADEFDFAGMSSSDDDENDEPIINTINNNNISWLLKLCVENLNGNQLIQPQIKLESLQLLCAMSRNYFDSIMLANLKLITNSIEITLNERNIDLKLHAGRCVDFIGQAICKYLQNNNDNNEFNNDCLQFWQTLLNGGLINLLQNEQHSILRAIGCDCLGSIGAFIFEQLPRDRQIVCVTLLFACTQDEENNVKGAAVRALAICVLYPSLREDIGFVIDLCEAIYRTLNDDNLMVRIKSSWSLGNLSDALVINNQTNNSCCFENAEELPDSLLIKLLKACLNGASDNDKMKMNCVRALGNLMQLINDKKLNNTDLILLCEDAMNVLLKNCTTGSNMKVRWNSCYALGNVLKNSTIYCIIKPITFELIFNALMELVVNFRNFKVRINVALALSSPAKRDYYGQYFIPLWGALLKALENTQQIDDFMEYNHRDNLVDQICLTLAHLTSLIIVEDLIKLNEKLLLFMDLVKTNMNKVSDRLLPEKSTIILDALSHLQTLKSNTGLNSDERMALDNLLQIFVVNL